MLYMGPQLFFLMGVLLITIKKNGEWKSMKGLSISNGITCNHQDKTVATQACHIIFSDFKCCPQLFSLHKIYHEHQHKNSNCSKKKKCGVHPVGCNPSTRRATGLHLSLLRGCTAMVIYGGGGQYDAKYRM